MTEQLGKPFGELLRPKLPERFVVNRPSKLTPSSLRPAARREQGRNLLDGKAVLPSHAPEVVRDIVASAAATFPDDDGQASSGRDRLVGSQQCLSDDRLVGRDIGARIVSIAVENNEIAALACLCTEPVVEGTPVSRLRPVHDGGSTENVRREWKDDSGANIQSGCGVEGKQVGSTRGRCDEHARRRFLESSRKRCPNRLGIRIGETGRLRAFGIDAPASQSNDALR
jgi:hypothetical protein